MFKVIIITDANALTKIEFEILLPLVSPEKQKRIEKFRFFRDAQNALLGDILARIEICNATGLSNQKLEFSTNNYGKPFLVNNPQIHYNISHAGHYVSCAIDDKAVGIDIEPIEPVDLKIAERFFAPDEAAYIKNNHQLYRFFEVWTKKESRVKWEGKGLLIPLSSFSVFDTLELKLLSYHTVFRTDEVMCHVCSTKKELPQLKVIDKTILMQNCIKIA